jgi:hypothetical protein
MKFNDNSRTLYARQTTLAGAPSLLSCAAFSEKMAFVSTTCVRYMYLIRLPICLGTSESAEYDVYNRYADLVLA